MVFFDCGIIMLWIIDVIDDVLFFIGVCYFLNIFLVLQEKFQCCVVLCGGEFYVSNVIFMLLSFEDIFSYLSFDIVFYLVVGIDCEQGVICYNLEELLVKYWVMCYVCYYVLVVDYSKFGKVCLVCMGVLVKFDVIVSDICLDDELVVLVKVQQIFLLY